MLFQLQQKKSIRYRAILSWKRYFIDIKWILRGGKNSPALHTSCRVLQAFPPVCSECSVSAWGGWFPFLRNERIKIKTKLLKSEWSNRGELLHLYVQHCVFIETSPYPNTSLSFCLVSSFGPSVSHCHLRWLYHPLPCPPLSRRSDRLAPDCLTCDLSDSLLPDSRCWECPQAADSARLPYHSETELPLQLETKKRNDFAFSQSLYGSDYATWGKMSHHFR